MPTNNFLGDFNNQPVPVPRATRPFEVPNQGDTADIILRSAQLQELHKQKDAELQQNSIKMFSNAIETALDLGLRKKKMELDSAQNNAVLELHKAELELKKKPKMLSAADAARLGVPFGTTEEQAYGKTPKQTQGNMSQDMNRLLTTLENEKYGTPAGTRLKDVEGQVPLSPANRRSVKEITNAGVIIDNIESLMGQLGLGDTPATALAVGAKLQAESLVRSTVAARFKSAIKNISNVARGMGEKGPLTDEDLDRIISDLPGFTDTMESGKERLNRIRKIFIETQENMLSGFKGNAFTKSDEGKPKYSREELMAELDRRKKRK